MQKIDSHENEPCYGLIPFAFWRHRKHKQGKTSGPEKGIGQAYSGPGYLCEKGEITRRTSLSHDYEFEAFETFGEGVRGRGLSGQRQQSARAFAPRSSG
ncbi:MAG TPA: hypothetical protein VN673_15145 [Clostridia bacterium]|nr:hypothetical protein [Clostridia bacterium]